MLDTAAKRSPREQAAYEAGRAGVRPTTTYVYAIRRPDVREVKIGISADPRYRLRQLQDAHGSPLELVGVVPGDRSSETALHERFAAHRKLGEWFHESAEITAWLATLEVWA